MMALDTKLSCVRRQAKPAEDASNQNCGLGGPWDSPSEEDEALYGTSPPCTPRQMKRMSGKHQRNSQARSAGRSPNKGELEFIFFLIYRFKFQRNYRPHEPPAGF